jgi:hypothetical protein
MPDPPGIREWGLGIRFGARSVILFVLPFAACVNRLDPKAEWHCEWNEDGARTLELDTATDRAHLRDDAIIAEDLAIGHADRHARRRSSDEIISYHRVRTECMERLFSNISARHNVRLDVVRQYRLHRNRLADAAVIGGFGLLYVGAACVVSGWLLERFASDHAAVVFVGVVAVSLVMATAGMMLGEVWSIWFEVQRIGRGHLSYRVDRIPWVQFRLAMFACGVALFWVTSAIRYHRAVST